MVLLIFEFFDYEQTKEQRQLSGTAKMGKVLTIRTIKSKSPPDQSAEFHENNLSTTKKKELEVIKQENYMKKIKVGNKTKKKNMVTNKNATVSSTH